LKKVYNEWTDRQRQTSNDNKTSHNHLDQVTAGIKF
jgi:hypothetical protein